MEKQIDFIARHYRRGRFATDAAWRRMGLGSASRWRRLRVAAAVAGVVVLSATAAVLYKVYPAREATPTEVASPAHFSPLAQVRVIDFENAALPDVVASIEAVYGVRVENLPASPEEYELSLHYEGTPADLVATINDILGTEMTVREQ